MRHLLLSALLLTALAASPLPAQELTGAAPPLGVRVESGATARVEAHDVCRNVDNATNAPIMIPHRLPEEWSVGLSAFLENPYPGVTVSPCETGVCDPEEVVPGELELLYAVTDDPVVHLHYDGTYLHVLSTRGFRAYLVTEQGATPVGPFSTDAPYFGASLAMRGSLDEGDIEVQSFFQDSGTQYRILSIKTIISFDGSSYALTGSSNYRSVRTNTDSPGQPRRNAERRPGSQIVVNAAISVVNTTGEFEVVHEGTGQTLLQLSGSHRAFRVYPDRDGDSFFFRDVYDGRDVTRFFEYQEASGTYAERTLPASLGSLSVWSSLDNNLLFMDGPQGYGIYRFNQDDLTFTFITSTSAMQPVPNARLISNLAGDVRSMVYDSVSDVELVGNLIVAADAGQGFRVFRMARQDCPDPPPPPPPPVATVYDVGPCSVSAGGGDQSTRTACGPDYEAGLDMTFSFEDGTCEASGLARLRRMIGQNLAASFWHGYLCREVETGRPGHFHLGEVEAADPSVPDVTIGGAVHVAAEPFTLSGLTGDAVLSWSVGGWSQGAAVRINGGAWVPSETAPAASRTVQNGDRVEFALRTGGADANALNWALLTVTPSGGPELSLTRDFAVRGDRTASVNPVTDPASGAELVLGNILQTQTGGNMTAYQSAVMFINNLPSMPDVTPGGEIRIDGRDGTVINAEIFGPDCAAATGNPTCTINDPGTWSTGSPSYQGFLDLVCGAQAQSGSYSFYLLDVAGMSIGFPTDVRADVFECVPA